MNANATFMSIIKAIDSNLFPFLIVFVLLTGSLPAVTDSGQISTNKPVSDYMSINAQQVDNDLANLQLSISSMSVSERRIKAQDIEQRITKLWLKSSRTSGLSAEEYTRHELYVSYLLSASNLAYSMEIGDTPNTYTYYNTFFELTGISSRLS